MVQNIQTGTEIAVGTGDTVSVLFQVVWPYETGETADDISSNDEIDTYWGEKSYNYTYDVDEYAIEVTMRLEVVQDI